MWHNNHWKKNSDALKSMKNDKTPRNDGLSKGFYKVLWNDVKIPSLVSIKDGFIIEEIRNSKKQAAIKLIEKKEREAKDLLRTGDQYPC